MPKKVMDRRRACQQESCQKVDCNHENHLLRAVLGPLARKAFSCDNSANIWSLWAGSALGFTLASSHNGP
eukprot:2842214-Lingulodinium_polyedra.AAC.1